MPEESYKGLHLHAKILKEIGCMDYSH